MALRFLGSDCFVRSLSLIHISEPTRQKLISYAVFCVHELLTKQSDPKKRKANDDDLRRFLDVVFDARPKAAEDGSWVVGPLKVHGATDRMPSSMPLYVAKLVTPPA